ncbi:heme/hemin ABC transporter substrate-binding protein [Oceaniglobus roseus]|uniref:heme/hemin ABC transporter substrate-binding protein n=1 Tax=Oceaniglobus roseus TaxID=1737570 RepID=UPI000C7F31CB|nr:ABC transporter substrate-binding protein [Kandeliimicrobium roseum]
MRRHLFHRPLRGFASLLVAASLALSAPFVLAGPDRADVLSIGGAVTEIVAALGQSDRLLARDTTSTWPPEVARLPDVGYMRALSPEGVLSVGPGLILSDPGAGPPEALEVIRAAGVDFVEVPDTPTAEGILHKIEVIGAALDVPERAAELSREVKTALDRAMADAARPEAGRKRVLFVLSTQGGRINASGTGTAADALIRMAGGVNAVSGFEGYRQIGDEAVGLAAPDVILMMDRGGDHGAGDDELLAMPAVSVTPAAESRSVVRMDALLMLGFGPRTAEAVQRLNRALYGEDG